MYRPWPPALHEGWRGPDWSLAVFKNIGRQDMTATISRHWRLRAIRLMAVTFATLLAPAGHAQPTPPATEAPTSTPSASTKATTTMTREEWEKAIARVPQGKEGCFKATYPHLEWQEVP